MFTILRFAFWLMLGAGGYWYVTQHPTESKRIERKVRRAVKSAKEELQKAAAEDEPKEPTEPPCSH